MIVTGQSVSIEDLSPSAVDVVDDELSIIIGGARIQGGMCTATARHVSEDCGL